LFDDKKKTMRDLVIAQANSNELELDIGLSE
jgi:hypothetical protein